MKTKKIKAWAFMGSGKNGLYFITNGNEETEIYLKKPKKRMSPFDYFSNMPKWKPTELSISTIIKRKKK